MMQQCTGEKWYLARTGHTPVGLQEEKTAAYIIIHSSPAYNIITSYYHTRLQ